MTTSRRKRFEPGVRRSAAGKPHTLRVSKRDEAIFNILQRYRYLPADFIFELLPAQGNYKKYQERLTDLNGHRYLKRPNAQRGAYNELYKTLVYELGAKGKRYISDEGLSYGFALSKGNSFHHELFTAIAIASFEIHRGDFQFIDWPQLLVHEKVPETTKEAVSPFNLPVGLGDQNLIIPDGTPFVMKGKRSLCFVGVESDMHTENVRGESKATLIRKFRGYLYLAKKKVYQAHYGFPNMTIPFIATSESRMQSMMKALGEVTKGKGATFILFGHLEDYRRSEHSPAPVDLVNYDWARVGHPPLNLAAFLTS